MINDGSRMVIRHVRTVEVGHTRMIMERRAVRLCPCGTHLARDNHESRCARCQRAARDFYVRPPKVPTAFWDTPEMRQALATWHIGQVIRAYRTHPYHDEPITQAVAARWINLTQTQLSRIETGPTPDGLIKLAHWARALGVPPDLLWFRMPEQACEPSDAPVPVAGPWGENESWQLNRREQVATPRPEIDLPGALDHMNRRELLRLLAMAG